MNDTIEKLQEDLLLNLQSHLQSVYPKKDIDELSRRLLDIMRLDDNCNQPPLHESIWNQDLCFLITYGDSIYEEDKVPLKTLDKFIQSHLDNVISAVHILPFYPYSSDDGFSVIEYVQVNQSLGDWDDIRKLAKHHVLMADLVINHCSSRSRWFENFKNCVDPGKDYFFQANPDDDLSNVVRPRTSPLLREVETMEGKKYVWCTFSHDQIDMNFANPDVLEEFVKIIKFYLDQGVRVFRLDAIAFLWKEIGDSCINHVNTHEIVKIIRLLIEHHSPNAIIITETNVPNHENLSYFGNANEAHAVYNFSLPPLILHAMLTGTAQHLKKWQMSMPPAQHGTFYFNFLASHDGIGLRPAEGLLDEEDIKVIIDATHEFGGLVSWRTNSEGQEAPYEINIALYDAMAGTQNGRDDWQLHRFLCAHAIMLSLEGVPAIYIHSLLATNNYIEGVERLGHFRAINRFKWPLAELNPLLEDPNSHHHQTFEELGNLIKLRRKQTAFHPNSTQFTLHLDDRIFAYWRQSIKRDQSIFCLHNISDQIVNIPLSSINLISMDKWTDLISGKSFTDLHADLVLSPYQFVWLSNKS